jgi:hypothetical protein
MKNTGRFAGAASAADIVPDANRIENHGNTL